MNEQNKAAAKLNPSAVQAIKWLIAIGIPVILYFVIPQTEAVTLEMRKFFVVTAWAILTWAMNLLTSLRGRF